MTKLVTFTGFNYNLTKWGIYDGKCVRVVYDIFEPGTFKAMPELTFISRLNQGKDDIHDFAILTYKSDKGTQDYNIDIHIYEKPEGFSAKMTYGDSGKNTMVGDSKSQYFLGASGNDTIKGNGGVDIIDGGRGRDVIDGGSGRDHLVGGANADTFILTNGDTIYDYQSKYDQLIFKGFNHDKSIELADLKGMAVERADGTYIDVPGKGVGGFMLEDFFF